jgi:hypothetical protein
VVSEIDWGMDTEAVPHVRVPCQSQTNCSDTSQRCILFDLIVVGVKSSGNNSFPLTPRD